MTNKNFAKLENGNIKFAPNPLWIGGKMISNPTNEILLTNGYKPVKQTPQPQKDGYYYIPNYVDNGSTFSQVWKEVLI